MAMVASFLALFIALTHPGNVECEKSHVSVGSHAQLTEVRKHTAQRPSMMRRSDEPQDPHDTPTVPASLIQMEENSHATVRLQTWQERFREDPQIFEGCKHVFLDVGSNRGTHVRKLFEPSKYPKAPYLKVMKEMFGPVQKRSRPFSESQICAFGFEANPLWVSTLAAIEKSYTRVGWKAKWFAPRAVSNKAGNSTFWFDPVHSNSDWGASTYQLAGGSVKTDVENLDLAGFVVEMMKHVQPGGVKLMKMDIEGSEFDVLPSFIDQHLLCQEAIDKITIEWHDRFLDESKRAGAEKIRKQAYDTGKCAPKKDTIVTPIDDESYLNDGKPLP